MVRKNRKASARMTPAQIYTALSAPLDPRAYEPMDDGSGLISIVPAYRTERLNLVLGPDGWTQSEPEIISLEHFKDVHGKPFCDGNGAPIWEAVVKRSVKVRALRKTYFGQGGHRDTKRAWALQGAATAATGNALKDLIGVEVFKGLKNGVAGIVPQIVPNVGGAGSKVVTGLLEAAYFSAPKPWVSVDGERYFVLAPAVQKSFQKICAADERADRQSTIKMRVHQEGEMLVVDAVEGAK